MKNNITKIKDFSPFDRIRHLDDNKDEFWFATELLTLLGYQAWDKQIDTVKRGIKLCSEIGQNPDLYFRGIAQKQQIGDKGGKIDVIKDYKLSRLGCYLIVNCADSRKTMVKLSQLYFVLKVFQLETPKRKYSLDSLTLDDLETLYLYQEFDDTGDPETMLQGIDRVFWNMPKQIIEHLIAVRKYDRLMRCLPSQLKLYRMMRIGTYHQIPDEEAKQLMIENRDLDIPGILKKHAECDKAAANNDISYYRFLAEDPKLIRAAANFEKQIEKRLQSSPQKNLKAVE